MARIKTTALAVTLAAFALAGSACAAPEAAPVPDPLESFTLPAEPVETTPAADPSDEPDAAAAADARDACLSGLRTSYPGGLAVDGPTVLAEKTGADVFPDQTAEELEAAGIDPEARLILVTLTGDLAEGAGTEEIDCYVWPDGSGVALLDTRRL